MSETCLHSLIIPHRDQPRHLAACLDCIRVSASHCRIPDDEWEVIIADGGSVELPTQSQKEAVLSCPPTASEAELYNFGIEAALGTVSGCVDRHVITLLRPDMLIGRSIMARAAVTGLGGGMAYYYPVRMLRWRATCAILENPMRGLADFDAQFTAFGSLKAIKDYGAAAISYWASKATVARVPDTPDYPRIDKTNWWTNHLAKSVALHSPFYGILLMDAAEFQPAPKSEACPAS